MLTAGIVIVSIWAYLAVGYMLGRRDVPHFINHQRMNYGILYKDSTGNKRLHTDAALWVLLWVTCWPFVFTITRLVRGIAGSTYAADPVARGIELDERERRIAELERQLDIRDGY